MQYQSIHAGHQVVIKIGGQPVAGVRDYVIESTRAAYPVRCIGQNQPVAVICGELEHVIRLTAIDLSLTGISAQQLYQSANFTLEITTPVKVITFSGCNWKQLDFKPEDGCVIRSATLLAAQRAEANLPAQSQQA